MFALCRDRTQVRFVDALELCVAVGRECSWERALHSLSANALLLVACGADQRQTDVAESVRASGRMLRAALLTSLSHIAAAV